MKVGIIGRKGTGRSTLFEALTGIAGAAHTATKTRLGIARVHDLRVDRLTALCQPKKTVYAEITLAQLPDPATGAVDVTALREMRDIRAYAHVVGAFAGEPPEASVPREIASLATEMVLADMERVETRQKRISKGGGSRSQEDELLITAAQCLEKEQPLRMLSWNETQTGLLNELGLISHRPLITIVNVSEELIRQPIPSEITAATEALQGRVMWLCAPLEAEITTLSPEEQQEFLTAYGLDRPVSQRFVQTAFDLLSQICFFTVGPDEVRAWPIPQQTNAKRAARAIHSDLERGFIRAEVIDYSTFIELGSEARCRQAGRLRTEGKDYIVQDGDIITVRFNV
jgi:ribosome-binding ATPase YchF (GTP1/OBG family)